MAVGFNAVPFDVRVDDAASLPYPIQDDDGIETYTASLIVASKTNVDALKALKSTVTILPALAGGGLVVVEHGAGAKTLIFPRYSGVEQTETAILTAISARMHAVLSDHWSVDATRVIITSGDI